MKFDSVDLSDYGLTARIISPAPFMPPVKTSHVEIADKAYDFRAYLQPRTIDCEVLITGTAKANLISNLDAVSALLSPVNGLKELVLDFPDDRYYLAKVAAAIEYEIVTHKLARGSIQFICPDPLAYDNDAVSRDHDIDADHQTVTETTGGTAYIEPIYTLTAGEDLTDVTIKVECIETLEELQWIGSLTNGQELVIDVANWIVKKEGSASMATVSGQFPRLLPDQANHIKITNFSTTGSLTIGYRNRYL